AQVVNVVHYADVFAQLQQVTDGTVEVIRLQGAIVQAGSVRLLEQLDVELQTAHARKVILARVEKHAVEQGRGGVQGWRVAGTQLAVDFDQRFLRRLH